MPIKKLSYKQYVFDYIATWDQEKITEKNKFISGERIEYKNKLITKNPTTYFCDIKKIFPESNLKNLVHIIIYAISDFKKIVPLINFLDIHFLYHNELIVINESIVDHRLYQFFRIVVKDNFQDTYVDEITVDINSIFTNRVINQICLKLIRINNYLKLKSKYIGIFKNQNIPVVYSPQASGFFIHEVIGHLLEEDVYNLYGKKLLDQIRISNRLSVIDDPTNYKNIVGLNMFDDHGEQVNPICLIENGILQNILSSDKGVMRRENYNKIALPRMRSTFICPYSAMDTDKIMRKYNKCVIITHVYAGSCEYYSGNYCMYGHGQLVVNGKIISVLSNIKISSSIKEHLENIEYIGNDFNIFSSDCSKIGHVVKVSMGGPTVSFPCAIIEGRQYI